MSQNVFCSKNPSSAHRLAKELRVPLRVLWGGLGVGHRELVLASNLFRARGLLGGGRSCFAKPSLDTRRIGSLPPSGLVIMRASIGPLLNTKLRIMLIAAVAVIREAGASLAPLIEFAKPAMLAANHAPAEVTLSGTWLYSTQGIRLSHYELGLAANTTELTSTRTSVTFVFRESWPAGSVQVQALSANGAASNLFVLTLYTPPNVTSITPNITSIAGGSLLTLAGDGLFASKALQVSITTDYTSQIVEGRFVEEDGTVQLAMPQLPIPSNVDIAAIGPRDETMMNSTVRLSVNGVDWEESTVCLSIFVRAIFKIAYLYSGPVSDHGWTFNWNLGRMEVDSRHPSIVESEYVESVSEDMFTSVPAAEQQAAVLIRHYCERNFEMVVGNSFGFMPAFVHMSNEPVCNFWFNATSGSVSSIPQSTYFLHGTGVIQVCAVNVLSSRPALTYNLFSLASSLRRQPWLQYLPKFMN